MIILIHKSTNNWINHEVVKCCCGQRGPGWRKSTWNESIWLVCYIANWVCPFNVFNLVTALNTSPLKLYFRYTFSYTFCHIWSSVVSAIHFLWIKYLRDSTKLLLYSVEDRKSFEMTWAWDWVNYSFKWARKYSCFHYLSYFHGLTLSYLGQSPACVWLLCSTHSLSLLSMTHRLL